MKKINDLLGKKYSHLQFCFLMILLMVWLEPTFADDLLNGTTAAAKDTLNGSFKTYAYITEGIMAIAAYIKTKNLLVLIGIAVLAFFLNTVLKHFIA